MMEFVIGYIAGVVSMKLWQRYWTVQDNYYTGRRPR